MCSALRHNKLSVKFTEHISSSDLLTYNIFFRPAGMVQCGGGSVVETLNSLQKDRLRSSNSSRDTNSRLRIAIAPTVYKQLFINAIYPATTSAVTYLVILLNIYRSSRVFSATADRSARCSETGQ